MYTEGMQGDQDEQSVVDIRNHFSDVLHAVATQGRITYVTSRGKRLGAVVPTDLADAAITAGGPNMAAALLQGTQTHPAAGNPVLALTGEVLWATNTDLAMRLIAEVFRRTGRRETRIDVLNELLNDAVTEYLDRNDPASLEIREAPKGEQ